MRKTLYHGTNAFFDEFKNKYLCTENSIDQYGSGFYFYEDFSKTILHGGLRVTANVELGGVIEHTDRWNPSYDDIETLILKSPNLENRLCDWGDINYEGFDKVLKRAVKSYAGESFYTDSLNALGNDFFSDNDTHVLLNAFIKLTGINCIKDSERGIFVILSKRFIEIESVKLEEEWGD